MAAVMMPTTTLMLPLMLFVAAATCTQSASDAAAATHHSIDMGLAVDLKRYPIHHIDSTANSKRAAVVQQCRQMLVEEGACVLPQFFTSDIVAHMQRELLAGTRAYSDKWHTLFQLPVDSAYPADHVRNRLVHASIGFVPRRSLAQLSILNILYSWQPLVAFLAEVAGHKLYLSGDTDGAVYGTVNSVKDITAWHFDQHPFSAVALVQKADDGGLFEWSYTPKTETEEERFHRLQGVLDGESVVRSLSPREGALIFFNGNKTLHQVSKVFSEKPRISAVFAYALEPNFKNSDEVRAANTWTDEAKAGKQAANPQNPKATGKSDL